MCYYEPRLAKEVQCCYCLFDLVVKLEWINGEGGCNTPARSSRQALIRKHNKPRDVSGFKDERTQSLFIY